MHRDCLLRPGARTIAAQVLCPRLRHIAASNAYRDSLLLLQSTMVKLEVCSFSGYKIPASHGRWYIRVDGASPCRADLDNHA